jgi:hypothetical protein
MPEALLEDEDVFPERDAEEGAVYVEAEDKETVEKVRNITFVRAFEILGIIYKSRSGRTYLKWRSTRNCKRARQRIRSPSLAGR